MSVTIQPVVTGTTVRNTDWVIVCPRCQCERIVSYCQAWNIKKNNCVPECKSFALELGKIKINYSGLKVARTKENQEKAIKGRTGIKRPQSKKFCEYRNLFNNPVITLRTREKMRKAKLGKFGPLSNRWTGGQTEEKRKLRNRRIHEFQTTRMKTDPAFYAMKIVRNRVQSFLKGKYKISKKLGCDYQTFKHHIETQFQPGMCWDNYGEWHLDHKFPLSIAITYGPDIFKKACHYTNLQPLWAKENISKSNKVTEVEKKNFLKGLNV